MIETPHIADNNSIADYLIVLAMDLDEATEIAKKCPIVNGHNTSVEIREAATPQEIKKRTGALIDKIFRLRMFVRGSADQKF